MVTQITVRIQTVILFLEKNVNYAIYIVKKKIPET